MHEATYVPLCNHLAIRSVAHVSLQPYLTPCWVGVLLRRGSTVLLTGPCTPHLPPCRVGMLSRLVPSKALCLSADQAQSTVQKAAILVLKLIVSVCGWRKWKKEKFQSDLQITYIHCTTTKAGHSSLDKCMGWYIVVTSYVAVAC